MSHKWLTAAGVALALLFCCSCAGRGNDTKSGGLTKEEQETIDAVDGDVTYISNDNFGAQIEPMLEDMEGSKGKIVVAEGVLAETATDDGESTWCVTRDVVQSDGKTVSYSIPLNYVEDAPEAGAQVRVIGIWNYEEHGDHLHGFLDVLTLTDIG